MSPPQVDPASLRTQYLAEKATYEKLGRVVKGRIEAALKTSGLSYPVTARAKEVASVVRKAIDKHSAKPEAYSDPIAAMKDKSGVRVLVPDLDARSAVDRVIRNLFGDCHFEDTQDRLEPDRIGYIGWHYEVTLPSGTLGTDLELRDRICEIQVQTKAQNAWSDQSHALTYKAGPTKASPAISRRLNQAMVLIELFDR